MNTLIQQLSNRDLALITWIVLILIVVFFLKPFREFIKSAFSIFTQKTFLIVIFLLFSYLIIILWGISSINLWNFKLIKDTLFWLIGVGLVIPIKSITKNIEYFKEIALSCIKYTLLIEFITNLHVFSYVAELVLFPTLFFIILIQVNNEYKVKNPKIEKLSNLILGIYGVTILLYAIYKTIQNYKLDFTVENLQSLLLPSILTILILPFSYFLTVYSAYENMFIKLYNVKNVKYSNSTIKWKLFKRTTFNLRKIREINLRLNPYYLNLTENIDQYLNDIEKPVTNKVS